MRSPPGLPWPVLSLARCRPATRWAVLLVLTALAVGALELVRLPAALLLGAMAAGIALAALDGPVRVPRLPFQLAQAVIGCLIGRAMTLELFGTILRDWPVFVAAVLSVVAASAALGWLLARSGLLPGTTAVWGMSPGAASAITLMAEDFGADVRLVAVMQYVRVVLVTAVASAVAHYWVVTASTGATPAGATAPATAIVWFPAVAWPSLAATLAVIVVATLVARRFNMSAGPMLLAIVIAMGLQDAGLLVITLPPWLLAASYALIGWTIGLRFTRSILIHTGRALPIIVAAILVLIAICGGFAVLLVYGAGVDPLTAYLATSPGGADSVAIIAATSPVDVPFVMALQMARFLVVLLTGPAIARFVAVRVSRARRAR